MSSGLEDVVASTSAITFIDGARGRLLYRGYDIKDLAEKSNYEEVAYLLLRGHLPKQEELTAFSDDLSSQRVVPQGVRSILDSLLRESDTMDALEVAMAALGIYDDPNYTLNERAVSIAAKMATMVAHLHRHRYGLPYLEPKSGLGTAANFLYLVTGKVPDESSERLMDTIFVLHADHELNASTFTARVVASTLSDVYSSITAAVTALKGPLHGGANERVVEMVEEIGSPENVESYLRDKLAKKEKIMGFGHRVYKTLDPRAKILLEHAERVATSESERNHLAILEALRKSMLREKGLYPNVDFYSGLVLQHLGIPTYLFTPVFAVGRTPGWLAHVMEQYSNNRIMRPIAEYTGPRDERYEHLPVGRSSVSG